MGFTIFVLVTAAAAAGVFFALKGKSTAQALPDKERFAKAFTPVPASSLTNKQDSKPAAGMKTHVVAPPNPNDPPHNLEGGESTMAIKFVPDSSVAPIPGFADIYKKIALGEIRGHVMVVAGPDKGKGVELKGDAAITVGREKNHTLNLTDPGVSMHQCEIHVEAGKVVIADIGSRNGTYVNNQKIGDIQSLENCDIVTIGKTKLLVTLPG